MPLAQLRAITHDFFSWMFNHYWFLVSKIVLMFTYLCLEVDIPGMIQIKTSICVSTQQKHLPPPKALETI